MKKLILLYFIVLSQLSVFAQSSFTDNINLGTTSGNLNTLATPGEWRASHGTPSYSGPGGLWMWAQNGIGEGTYRNLAVTPNTDYQIKIGINEFVAGAGTGEFTVLLANDFTPNSCQSGCALPGGMFSNSRLLHVYSGSPFTNQSLRLRFSTGAGESYTRIVIYPGNFNSLPLNRTELSINCLSVYNCPIAPADLNFCSTISTGTYNANNINIGGSFCGSSGMASSTLGNTFFRARNKVEVRNNTTIAANSNGPTILEIVNSECVLAPYPSGQVGAFWDFGNCNSIPTIVAMESPIANYTLMKNLMSINVDSNYNQLKVFPNPTNGLLNLQLNIEQAGTVKVLVTDVTGRKMHQQLFESHAAGLNTFKMNLSGLAQGIYLIELQTADGKKSINKVQFK